MIQLSQVTKRFGGKEALKSTTFQLKPGEVVGLLGHNGAGKTTTLRLMVGLLDPSTGSISRPANFRSVTGYLPDEPFLFDYLTGREMLNFMAALYGIPRPVTEHRLRSLLSSLEMGSQADRLLKGYSRGMRRKISLIGSILHEPLYWLLDEPTESLDPMAVKTLKDLIAMRRNQGGSVMISTHNLTVAESLCDRILVLHEGSLLLSSTMRRLRTIGEGTMCLEDLYVRLLSSRAAESPQSTDAAAS